MKQIELALCKDKCLIIFLLNLSTKIHPYLTIVLLLYLEFLYCINLWFTTPSTTTSPVTSEFTSYASHAYLIHNNMTDSVGPYPQTYGVYFRPKILGKSKEQLVAFQSYHHIKECGGGGRREELDTGEDLMV